jgi:hypothetical protein
VAAGAITGSLALLAFGLDSVIDGSASAVLVWRFRLELRQAGRPGRAERMAARGGGGDADGGRLRSGAGRVVK